MILRPRIRKVIGDIAENPASSALSVLAMSAGVFGLGMILTAWSVLARELPRAYLATRPATAVLVLDKADDGAATAVAARTAPGVRDAELRPEIRGRLRATGRDWTPLIVYVIADFGDVRMDRITPEPGCHWPPADDEILLERTALSVAGAGIGDRVTVRVSGAERTVRIAGTVHAPGLPPSWMEHVVVAYAGRGSALHRDTGPRNRGSIPPGRDTIPPADETAALRIVTASDTMDASLIRAEAQRAAEWLGARGTAVSRIDVPAPGRHPHAAQMETFLFLLGAFGALATGLGAILVATMIQARLAGQVRQIGIMKAIGAGSGQIAALYLGAVGLLAGASLLVGLPLGLWAGRAYVRFAASMLNLDVARATPPAWVVVLQVLVGALVPLAASLVPVIRASHVSVREALDDQGLSRLSRRGPLFRWAVLERVPRPLLLTLRTTFRRRGRLALTVGMLGVGGGAFVAAINSSGAWTRAIAVDAATRRWDVDVRLDAPCETAALRAAIASVPEVVTSEFWNEAGASVIGADDKEIARTAVIGPDPATSLLAPRVREGRWLTPSDTDAIVVNQALLAKAPALRLGSRLTLRARGRTVEGPIVGIVDELWPVPIAYVPKSAARPLTGLSGDETRWARVVTRAHDAPSQVRTARALDAVLAGAGIDVDGVHSLADRRKALEDHLVIILSALLLAAALVILIASVGLTSVLSIGVLERTREIGILGAIGAPPRAIARDVVVEGIVIGLLSWIVALVLAIPLTLVIGSVAGRIFFGAPLALFLSPGAAVAWLVLVVLLASVSSFLPAWRAARLEVSEALAHA